MIVIPYQCWYNIGMKKTGYIKKCPICGKEFYAPGWLLRNGGGKFCSHRCYAKSKIGTTPWNKGLKGVIKPNGGTFGKGETKWKGTLTEYKKLHNWVNKYLGKPNICEICGEYKIGHKIHWANKSGKYKKEAGDWIRLCAKCHYKYDNTEKRRLKYAKK